MAEKKKFNIKFSGIEIVEKSMVAPIAELNDAEQLPFVFNFAIDMKLQMPHKAALVLTDVTILSGKEDKSQFAKFKTICVFEFPENFDEYFLMNDSTKTYNVPIELEIILKSAGLSTTRGIIFSEVKGTFLHTAVLPLVDVATLIINDRKKKEQEIT